MNVLFEPQLTDTLPDGLIEPPANSYAVVDPNGGIRHWRDLDTGKVIRGRASAPGARWVDRKTGKEIRTLRPDERLADTIEVAPEQRGLRVGKYLRGLITGRWDGAEAEQRAAMTTTQAATGGNLLPSPLAAYVIDLARNRSVVTKAGATLVPMTAPTLDTWRTPALRRVMWTTACRAAASWLWSAARPVPAMAASASKRAGTSSGRLACS